MDPRFALLPEQVDVFVAYATPDREVVRRLVGALRALGWSTFWDQDLFVGDDWTLVLPEALRRARVVAVVVSARYNGALYLRDEVVVAIRRYRADPTRRVVPVLLGTRADLEAADPYGLSVLNPVDHADAAPSIDRLLRALAGMPPAPPAPPARPDLDRLTGVEVELVARRLGAYDRIYGPATTADQARAALLDWAGRKADGWAQLTAAVDALR